jgi:thiol-disulfide isomerase/thioredoxin
MAEAKRRRRQQQQADNVTTIDGNKILRGIGALIVVLGVGALAFWVAGLGSSSTRTSRPVAQVQPAPQSQPQTPSQPRSSSGSGGVSVGPASAPAKGIAPDTSTTLSAGFSVPTLDGGTFSLADQKGKPTVVFFMAYWCGTCVPEAQALDRIHQEYGDKVSILALDIDPSSSPQALQRFVQMAGNPSYTFGFDKDNTVLQKFKVRSLDTTIIIDADGNIVYRDSYPTPYKTLKAALEKVVS